MISSMMPPRPAGAPAPEPGQEPSDPASPPRAPLRAEVEQACRGMPATPEQRSWAICRPAPRRVPRPAVGDDVLYRHDSWLEPIPARVLWVQPDDDVDDPHVCQVQTDGQGMPVLVEGRPVFVTNPDAWLTVKLAVTIDGSAMHMITREARLPGSPGWLPLDWATRWRPMPWEI
jgi:hypothetical protein